MAFDADAYVAGLTDAEARNMMGAGANLATYAERKAVSDALSRRMADINRNSSYGGAGLSGGLVRGATGGGFDGTYADGSSIFRPGADGRGVNEIPMPDGATAPLPGGPGVQDPTAPGIVDYGGSNIRPEDGSVVDGVFVPPVEWDTGQSMRPDNPADFAPNPSDMDWDWGRFGTQTDTGGFGQYFDQYDASARYSPGKDASWGSDRFPGDNEAFYQNQFGNLIRGEQGFQAAQRMAAQRMRNAQENPLEAPPMDWSWIEGGLPEVELMDSGYAKPLAGLNYDSGGYQKGGAVYVKDPVTGEYKAITAGGILPPGIGSGGVGSSGRGGGTNTPV